MPRREAWPRRRRKLAIRPVRAIGLGDGARGTSAAAEEEPLLGAPGRPPRRASGERSLPAG